MFLPLLALTTTAAAAALVAAGTADTAVFPIDAGQRGASIVQAINSYLLPPNRPLPLSSLQSQVAVQTTLTLNFPTLFPMVTFPTGMAAGLIPNVQSATSFNTLLILGCVPPNYPTGNTILNYVVVPVETVVDVIYTTRQISTTALNTGYTSVFPAGVLPFFLIDPVQRAADIQNLVTTLNSQNIYNQNNPALYKVNIQTTLTGTFTPAITNGLITNVQSATVIAPGLLAIKYPKANPPAIPIDLGMIIVSAEQVTGITYIAP